LEWFEIQLHKDPVGGGRCTLLERAFRLTLSYQHRYGNLISYFLIAPSLNYANVSCSPNRRLGTLTCHAAVSISDCTQSIPTLSLDGSP